jgi:hypothetical protein
LSKTKNGLKSLYGSKLGKILPVLVIAGLVASASASVFVNYYASGTATAQNNNLSLVAGTDASSTSCGTTTPCVNVAIPPQKDYAAITLNLGVESSQTPQPETYFTNVTVIHNAGTTTRTVNVNVTSATESSSFFGSLTVYYCSVQSNTPGSSSNCHGLTMTSDVTSSTSVASAQSLAAGGNGYIELVGYAGSSATAGTSTLNFDLQFQWA